MDTEAGPSHPISPHSVHDEHDSDSDDELAFPDPATTDFPISLSHELVELSPNDEIQFAAIRTLERIKRQGQLITGDSDTSDSSEDEILEWEQYSDEEQEEAVEHGKKLVMRYDDQPVEDLDARWFLMVFLDHFPNCQGLPPPGVSIKRWLKHLVLRHDSLFQRADFVCGAGDWLLRHGVNLAAFLQFKSSPDQFHMANRATSEDVERTAKLLARGARPNNDDLPEVKALFSQVQAVTSRTPGSPYNAMVFRRHLFAGSVHFGAPTVFFTINPLETRSPFCWKLAGGENELYHYPLPGSNPPEIDDWKMIQLVRKRPMAQAIFFREVISAFLEVACGFKGVAVYSHSRVPEFTCFRVQQSSRVHHSFRIPKFLSSRVPEYSKVPEFPISRVPQSLSSRVPEYSKDSAFSSSRVREFPSTAKFPSTPQFPISQVPEFLSSRVPEYSKVPEFPSSRVPEFPSSQIPEFPSTAKFPRSRVLKFPSSRVQQSFRVPEYRKIPEFLISRFSRTRIRIPILSRI